MIDTDKYEGHSPAPWRIAEGQPYDDEVSYIDIVSAYGVRVTETSYFTDNDPNQHPNIPLMVDAPLLLAEVKRLRWALAYTASLLTCRIEGDDIPVTDIREYALDVVDMTVDEAMATTDLMEESE